MTPKQERFVAEYLVDLNATQAAIRAGYSAKTANEQGSQLLAKLSVRAAVDEALAKRAGKLEITAEKVLRDIEETRLAATSVAQHATALRASELQGKHVGMFAEKTEATITHQYVVRVPTVANPEEWAKLVGFATLADAPR